MGRLTQEINLCTATPKLHVYFSAHNGILYPTPQAQRSSLSKMMESGIFCSEVRNFGYNFPIVLTQNKDEVEVSLILLDLVQKSEPCSRTGIHGSYRTRCRNSRIMPRLIISVTCKRILLPRATTLYSNTLYPHTATPSLETRHLAHLSRQATTRGMILIS